jgi:energy-converting hydrogenase Eha subunit B
MLCGGYGNIVHFNGFAWKSYLGNELQRFNGNLTGIDFKGNTVCAIGSGVGDGNIGVIMIGKRN